MHLLMLTPQVDRNGWVTGFIHGWIDQLARHDKVRHLNVICLEQGEYALPSNTTIMSMGKEHGRNRVREFRAFQEALSQTLSHVDLVFGHMIPRFTLAAAPRILSAGLPVVQWYTHRQATLELRLVHAIADRIVTASPDSFPLQSDRITILGHGIDTEVFHPVNQSALVSFEGPLILAVGRLSPIKHYEALIEAVGRLAVRAEFQNMRVLVAGGTTPEHGEAYATELKSLASDWNIADRITFLGPIPHQEIASLYHQADLTINLCPTGGADKAVLESMASGVPVLVRNETFRPLLDGLENLLWCPSADPHLVSEKLAGLLALTSDERRGIGLQLCERMQAEYALPGFIDRLVNVFEDVISAKRRRN